MRIDDLLKSENPELIDISAEYANRLYLEASASEKYIIYKAYTSKCWSDSKFENGILFRTRIRTVYTEKEGRTVTHWISDPDSGSELLQQIYIQLWPFMFDSRFDRTWSDSMTSVQYTMATIFEHFIENDESKDQRLSSKKGQKCSLKYMLEYFAKEFKSTDIIESVRLIGKEIEKVNYICDFLSACHSIGNYCPVPYKFNQSRSSFGRYDMWDLTLMIIRNWYLETDKLFKKKLIINDLYHFSASADIDGTEKWLDSFGSGQKGWENFVDTFLFQDWVDMTDKDSDKYYEVIPLWNGHDLSNADIPLNNLKEFFENYRDRIRARGMRIVLKLRERSTIKN